MGQKKSRKLFANAKSAAMNFRNKRHKPATEEQYKKWQRLMNLGYKLCRCHQLPERSFYYHGFQFPVCARCTGILCGFFILGPIITIFTFGNMYVSLLLFFLMIFDGGLQLITKYHSNNLLRLMTGLGFGYASFSLIVHIVERTIYLICNI